MLASPKVRFLGALVLSLSAACGSQTSGNVGSTSPGAPGGTTSAGGSATAATGGGAGTGQAGMGGAGTGATGTGGVGTGKGGAAGAAASAGSSGIAGAGGFPACCGPTAPCPGGYECVDTICVVPPAAGKCFAESDCAVLGPGSWTCDGGKVCPCTADCSFSTLLGTCVSGAGGAAGASGAGGATGACPATFPSNGEPCAPDGLHCPGGACCGPSANCVNGTWQIVISTCPLPKPCPASPPADGSSCCGGFPASCAWDECATIGSVAATCSFSTGTWTVTTEPCDGGAPCNGATCAPGEICVEHQGGAGISFTCTKDPCGSAPLSCTCAGSICGAPPMGCLVTDPKHLTCTCDTCP